MEQEIWDTLHRHLASIFNGDVKTYEETTAKTSRCLSGGWLLIGKTDWTFTAS